MFPFLSSKGVLGLNARNLLYIKPFNPRKAVAFADDKLKTKAFLAARDIPVAKIFARIESREQLQAFDFKSLPDECVLKPNYGFGGEGILILKGRSKTGEFLEQGKTPIPEQRLREHIEDILDGRFSVNGMPDTAFFEKILVAADGFAPFRPAGLPDIRIVVFNLVPVMAMLRVPTAQSRGKANVHLGGIGIGIDIAKGITTYATQFNRIITELPHGAAPGGIKIPHWDEMLLIASRIQYITNIGYLAVDLTIDKDMGPALLEVNARAGLMVQVANLAPLRARLERVGGIKVSSPEKGVRLAQDLFGEKVSLRDEEEEDRPVLGTRETIVISGSGAKVEAASLIATDRDRTIFARDLLRELDKEGLAEVEDAEDESYRVKFSLGGRKIQTVVRGGDMPDPAVRAVIGRRDLSGFLIDPSKATALAVVHTPVRDDLRAIDNLLSQMDHDLLLLKFLKPVNLHDERARLDADRSYNPHFTYRPLLVDLDDVEGRLSEIAPDDSPLGTLFKKKRRELLLRANLLRSRGDARRFTEASSALFGLPTADLQTSASSVLKSQTACDLPTPESELLSAEEAAAVFTEVLERYGLHDWQVAVRPHLVADCTVGGRTVYVREGAKFSEQHVESLIAHEIETHVLTAENGLHQPFELFRAGFAHYLDTQEGLAIYNQNRVLSPHHDKRYGPARNVLALAYALEHSFADTRAYLQEELGYRPEKALTKTIDMKRGLERTEEAGGFTKGLVYFRGLSAIEGFVRDGGDLKRLYIGKVPVEDLDVIEQTPELKAPILIPDFLRGKDSKRKAKR
jgi:alpha-L-glutamate ligase-like protein/uncharacterized protein (TIGR02421 family)